jgi:DNA-binding MarR family transcriptional regulator
MDDDEIDKAELKVRSSDVSVNIIRELHKRGEKTQPSKILNTLEPQMNTTSGNFYGRLTDLREADLVNKMERENSKTTLYWLTDKGEAVAERLESKATEQPSGTSNSKRDPVDPPANREPVAAPAAKAPEQSVTGNPDQERTENSEQETVEIETDVITFLARSSYSADEILKAAEIYEFISESPHSEEEVIETASSISE